MQRVHIIERKLRSKWEKYNTSRVIVSDLTALQLKPSKGEFGLSSKTSEDVLIDRMLAYIQQLANEAEQIHIQNNFANPNDNARPSALRKLAIGNLQANGLANPSEDDIQDEIANIKIQKQIYLQESKLDHITRLSMHEFALYPSEKQGPLSKQGFENLISKINQLALDLPPNLHLMLATVPVSDGKELQNLGIYVQCGENTRITPFAKAIPAHRDPLYPNTTYHHFSKRVPNRMTLWNLTENIRLFLDMSNNLKFAEAMQSLQVIRQLLMEYPIEGAKALDISLVQFEKNLHRYKYTNTEQGRNLLNEDRRRIYDAFTKYNNEYEDMTYETSKVVPHAAIAGQSSEALYFSGDILCTTAGGTDFHVQADICLDHNYQIALNHLTAELESADRIGDMNYSNQASYLITSNPTDYEVARAPAQSVIHIDPQQATKPTRYEGKNPTRANNQKVIKNPAFGPTTLITHYPDRPLLPHVGELEQKIIEHNALVFKLKALRIERSHRPNAMLDAEIIETILQSLRRELSKFPQLSNYQKQLENNNCTFEKAEEILRQISDEIVKLQSSSPEITQLLRTIERKTDLLNSEKYTSQSLTKMAYALKNMRLQLLDEVSMLEDNVSDHGASNANRNNYAGQSNFFSNSTMTAIGTGLSPQLAGEPQEAKPVRSHAMQPTPNFPFTSFMTLLPIFSSLWQHYVESKEPSLSENDIIFLQTYIDDLRQLKIQFEQRKQKQVVEFHSHPDNYEKLEIFFNESTKLVKSILEKGSKNESEFNLLKERLKAIKATAAEFSNKKVKKLVTQKRLLGH